MYNIRWIDFPLERMRVVEPIIMKYAYILPGWLEELLIKYEPCLAGGSGTWARCEPCYKYRRAVITVHRSFFDNSEMHDFDDTILHELCHVFQAPIFDVHYQLPKEMRDQHSLAVESSNSDVAYAIRRAMETK